MSSNVEHSDEKIDAFEDLIQGYAVKKICIISFGPVEDRNSGYFIRTWQMIETLYKKVDKVTVLEFPENDVSCRTYQKENILFIRLTGNKINNRNISIAFKRKLTFDPIHLIKFQAYSAYDLLRHRRQISTSDLIIVEGSLIPFANLIAKIYRKRVVLDTHLINKLLASEFKQRDKLVYVVRTLFWHLFESFTMKLSDIIIVVSDKEKRYVENEYHVKTSKIRLIPHTTDCPLSIYTDEELQELRRSLNIDNNRVILFVGDLLAVQNQDAANFIVNELAPNILNQRDDVVFLIVGRGDELFSKNNRSSHIIFTGFVQDLGKYLSISDVCIAPMRVGAGTKTKVLDYIKYRRKILTTAIGAEGLENYSEYMQICKIDEFADRLSILLGTSGKGAK